MQKAAQEILGSTGNFPATTNKYWRSLEALTLSLQLQFLKSVLSQFRVKENLWTVYRRQSLVPPALVRRHQRSPTTKTSECLIFTHGKHRDNEKQSYN